MDKWRTKLVWMAAGIPTPEFRVVHAQTDWMRVVAEVGDRLIMKPAREGSTIGITKVTTFDHGELAAAYAEAVRHDPLVLVEELVEGTELTASVLGDQALPLVRIVAPQGNYDYENKYFTDDTKYYCPSGIDPEFKDKVGENTSVEFPGGLGGKGNEGVAALASRTDGAIGYVEYAYALQNKMTYAKVQNKEGNFVSPSSDTFKAAAAGADWSKAPGYYLMLTDQAGKNSWPISGATFILMYKTQQKPDTAKEVLKFFDFAYSPDGDKLADSLDYVPLPDLVTTQIRGTWKAQFKDPSGKPIL